MKEILTSYKIGLIQVGKRKTLSPSLHSIIPLLIKEKRINGSADRYGTPRNPSRWRKKGEGVTSYSITIDKIKAYMRSREDDWVTVDEILEHCETHYRNPRASVTATLKEKWNQDWCETKLENRRRVFRIK